MTGAFAPRRGGTECAPSVLNGIAYQYTHFTRREKPVPHALGPHFAASCLACITLPRSTYEHHSSFSRAQEACAAVTPRGRRASAAPAPWRPRAPSARRRCGRTRPCAALLAAKMGRYAAECELLRHTLVCARGVLLAVGDPPAASGPDPAGSTP